VLNRRPRTGDIAEGQTANLLYYAHKLDAQRINIQWRAWPQDAVAQAWEPAGLAGAPSADSGSPLATGTQDERSRRGFSDFSRL